MWHGAGIFTPWKYKRTLSARLGVCFSAARSSRRLKGMCVLAVDWGNGAVVICVHWVPLAAELSRSRCSCHREIGLPSSWASMLPKGCVPIGTGRT